MSVNEYPYDASQMVGVPAKSTFRDYVSVTKVGITVANLMSTFAGLWVGAHGRPHVMTVVFTLVGTAFIVASGACLNNFIDRDIDQHMERTSARAVVTGKVKPAVVLWMGFILGLIGLTALLVFVNVTAAISGLIGLVSYAYLYTVWLKRTTTLSTVLGGVAGAMPPLIGFSAGSGGSINIAGLVLFFVFFLWQPPHFLPLAMKRAEEYRSAGIPMLPVIRGFLETKRQILRYTAAMVPVSLLLYGLHYEGMVYLILATAFGMSFLWKAAKGFSIKDDLAWANNLFKFSLLYLTTMCVALVVSVR